MRPRQIIFSLPPNPRDTFWNICFLAYWVSVSHNRLPVFDSSSSTLVHIYMYRYIHQEVLLSFTQHQSTYVHSQILTPAPTALFLVPRIQYWKACDVLLVVETLWPIVPRDFHVYTPSRFLFGNAGFARWHSRSGRSIDRQGGTKHMTLLGDTRAFVVRVDIPIESLMSSSRERKISM